MSKKETIETQITAALTDDNIGSGDVVSLISQVEAAIDSASRTAAAARDDTLDLDKDPEDAERTLRSSELKKERLTAALAKLQLRYSEIKDAEELAAWQTKYDAVEADRDAVAKEFHEKLPALFSAIVDLFTRMTLIDQQCSEVNATAPDSAHERLRSTELAARNIFGGNRTVLKTTQLPDLNDPTTTRLLWPPPQPNVAAAMAAAFAPAFDKRFSSKWWEAVSEDDARRRQIQAERVKQEEEQRAQAYVDYNQQRAGGAKQ